jgi:hypothetical protein
VNVPVVLWQGKSGSLCIIQLCSIRRAVITQIQTYLTETYSLSDYLVSMYLDLNFRGANTAGDFFNIRK